MASQTVLYVYGYAPGTTQELFCQEFFAEPFSMDYLVKIDFNAEKIFCFVHVHTPEQAQELIEHWNGKIMGSAIKPLQVRVKGQPSGGTGAATGATQQWRPREPLVFAYGFPPSMTEETFQQLFFGEEFTEIWSRMEKCDFLPQKTMCFLKLGSFEDCDAVIQHWNGRTMDGSDKPMQCRYKGQNSNQAPQTPTLFVYGYPKDMDEESFRQEFLANCEGYEKRIDYHPHKLIAYVHLQSTSQCDELIQTWNGNKFQTSEYPLQVRYFQQGGSGQRGGHGGRGRGRGRGGYGAYGGYNQGYNQGYGMGGGMGYGGGMGTYGGMQMQGMQMQGFGGGGNVAHPANAGFQYFASMPAPSPQGGAGGAAGNKRFAMDDPVGFNNGGGGHGGYNQGGANGGGKRAKMNPAMGGLNMGGSFAGGEQW